MLEINRKSHTKDVTVKNRFISYIIDITYINAIRISRLCAVLRFIAYH